MAYYEFQLKGQLIKCLNPRVWFTPEAGLSSSNLDFFYCQVIINQKDWNLQFYMIAFPETQIQTEGRSNGPKIAYI